MFKNLLPFILGLMLSLPAMAVFDLSQWPPEMAQKLKLEIPELQSQPKNEDEVNAILKKAYRIYKFQNLKIIQKNKQYYLVGTVMSEVAAIEFRTGQTDLDEELKELVLISPSEALQDSKVEQANDKLITTLKNKGYRNPKINVVYENSNTYQRNLIFKINTGPVTQIQQIEIQGLSESESEWMQKKIYWNNIGSVLTDDQLKQIQYRIRLELNQLGYYLATVGNPQIFYTADESKARLVYKLTGHKVAYRIELKGQREYSESYLLDEVLKLNDYFTTETNPGAELAEKLKVFYISQGFDEFDSTYYERKEKNKTITSEVIVLTLNIKEGPHHLISQIQFQGQISRPENYYRRLFKDFASSKLQDGILVRADVDSSLKNMITALQNEGFVSAKLNRWQVVKKDQRNQIIVNLTEGPETVLEQIQIKNHPSFPESDLLTAMGLKTPQRLNLDELEKALVKLKGFYLEKGYLEFQITTDVTELLKYNSTLTTAQLNIDIQEGPQIVVGSITLQGNLLTHDKLILTELEFKPGDILTAPKIEESISRLQKTSYFSSVEITTLEAGSAIKDRTVLVKLTERKPILFTAGIGATNENERTFHAYLGWAHRNFGGWGRGVSVRGDVNYNDVFLKFLEHKLTLGYLEPYLFESRTRFRVNYTTAVNVSDVNLRKQTISNSATWALEQDFTSHVTGIMDYSITTFVDKGMTPQDEIDYNYVGQDFVIASIGPTLDIDYRDNIINPQTGHFSRFTFEYAMQALGSSKVDDFVRMTGQSTLYLPFAKNKIIWANSIRGGYIKPVGTTEYGVPFDKKGFVLGGRSTIRGFESNEFFPSTDPNHPEYLPADFKLTMPSHYELIKSEFRFPLWSKYELDGGLFYDGGLVHIDGRQFQDEYRDSVGFGIRYNTPVGPLNLEYAHKLDKKPYESSGAFHLSVGVF